MTELTNSRKIEHIQAILDDPQTDRNARYFDRLQLTHRALPQLNLAEIETGIEFFGKKLSFPLLISSMTGGDHKLIRQINTNLAIAAEQTGVALAVGSQRVMFTDPQARSSFDLRTYAPNAVLLANIGAVQLNYGYGLQECQQAVDLLEADGLYLHLNPLQEAVQPEGDTNFADLAQRIADVVRGLDVPVLLKEVGSGLSVADIELGLEAGVRYFDVAGSGGTSWSRIEHHRRDQDELGLKFQDWGIPTPLALQLASPLRDRATLVASGGLRDGIDMVKSVILGASVCGLAAPFLAPAMESADAVVEVIERLHREYQTAMFLLGIGSTGELQGNSALIVDIR
ncbi:MAG TPA: type 2 isopentenyl-diphosphate Delta-isomerase [Marinobacterium sp.]|nr:type 2 isopentenyl-diphosphate Delta-isomerase [Marinobacterium sp.]